MEEYSIVIKFIIGIVGLIYANKRIKLYRIRKKINDDTARHKKYYNR